MVDRLRFCRNPNVTGQGNGVRHPRRTGACQAGHRRLCFALIQASEGLTPAVVTAAAVCVPAAGAFVAVEQRIGHPMRPLELFRSRQFAGAAVLALVTYAALGGVIFLFVAFLQLESELDEERRRGREVVDHDAHVLHALDRHALDRSDTTAQLQRLSVADASMGSGRGRGGLRLLAS